MDHTYKNLQVKIDAMAGECLDLIAKKMNIGEQSRWDYGIFECSQSGIQRCLANDECMYTVMNSWHDKQIFQFKKKPRTAEESEIRDQEIEVQDTAVETSDDADKGIRKKGKANKLAGFFGQEVDYMLKALNVIHGVTGNEQGLGELQTRTIQIDDIQKEGWLMKLEMTGITSEKWINCWCYIENQYFNISFKDKGSRDARFSSDNQTILDGNTDSNNKRWCLPLLKSSIKEGPILGVKNTFQIVYQEKTTVSMQAKTKEEYDDWIHALNKIKAVGKKDLKSKPGKASDQKPANDPYANNVNMGHFEILRVLGQGQYGKVFLCSQKSTGHHYAVKVIKKSNSPDSSLNENRILRGIRHPFIVGLHYAFQTKDKVMFLLQCASKVLIN